MASSLALIGKVKYLQKLRETRKPKAAQPSTDRFAAYRHDPVRFCSEVLGFTPWNRQADILEAVRDHPAVAVRSGHKIGKSTAAAATGLWWCATRPRALVIMTSSSYTQVKEILWPEVRRLYRTARQPIGGELFKTPDGGLSFDDGRRMFGMSTDETERMGGYSGAELLFLIDEASGVDEAIFEAIEGNRAGGGRVCMYGNPTQPTGTFCDAFGAQAEFWYGLHVSSEETPNVVQGRVVIPGLATREWVDERRRKWGEDDPRYLVRVRGNFPGQAPNSVIGVTVVEDAMARWNGVQAEGRLEIGVDVARFGDDDSVIQARRGLKAFRPVVVHGQDTVQIAGHALKVARALRRDGERPRVKVDVIGVGAGVADQLRQHTDIEVVDVNVAEASTDEENANLRSQLWFATAQWLKNGGAIPADRALKAELVAPTYKFDARGRQVVEPKDAMKKRLQRSPDRADALALSIYSPPLPPRGVGERPVGLF